MSFLPYSAAACDGRQLEAQNTALAVELSELFELGQRAVRVRAGNAVLSLPVYCPKTGFRGGRIGRYAPSGSLERAVTAVVEVLETRLERPGRLPGEQAWSRALIDGHSVPGVLPRTRVAVTPDLALVFFTTHVEFLIRADVAARLNSFLGEWLPDVQVAA